MSFLTSLMSSSRSAVVVPVEGESLSPGSSRWEAFFKEVRGPSVDVYGLYPIVGIMHERDAMRNPHHMSAHGAMQDHLAISEGAMRLRAWLYSSGIGYDRIVFIGGGPLAPMWSRGIAGIKRGTPLDPVLVRKIKVIPVRGRGASVTQGLPGLESPVTRAKFLNVLGRNV